MSRIKKFGLIRGWAHRRGLYDWGDPKTQIVKLGEEYGELCRAVIKQDKELAKDSLGDMVVVLVNAAHLLGFKLEDCLDAAWEEIKDREGSMVGGSFVKNDEPLKPGELREVPAPSIEQLTSTCEKCGMTFAGATGYVCGNDECPIGLNGPRS